MTRPTLFVHNAKREDLEASAKALFDVVSSGKVKIEINQTYALKDVGRRKPIWKTAKPRVRRLYP
jgi:NADPH2:quinone reductase